MKAFLSSILILLLLPLAARSQEYLTLAEKRINLISALRALGPLPPSDWLAGLPVVSLNYNYLYPDYPLHYQGNYGSLNLGQNPSGVQIYDYQYRAPGVWTYNEEAFANPNTRFTSFGMWNPNTPPNQTPNFWFNLTANAYNVAGLRYQSVFVVSGQNAQGVPVGWQVNSGQTVITTLPFNWAQTFDLGQTVEQPSFAIADYYFGRYLNYPPDTRAPTPQDTQAQSAGALLVSGVGYTNLLIGWAKEGVYRPGFTLQPGYSAPRLYTYMQQYFDKAWLADPVTGQPPRTSTTNWNGAGRINTTTATQTGQLNAEGGFIPTAPGKQIIATQPMENGHYGELRFYALTMRVDRNRDGLLTTNDVTSVAGPHVFWVNNDRDRAVYEEQNLWDELDVNDATPVDAEFTRSNARIPSLRDLEDYDRLHIPGLKELCRDLPTGQGYTVTLRWKSVQSGTPRIFVFKAADTQGGRGYLTNQTVAAAQIAPTVYPPAGTVNGTSPLAIGRVEATVSPVLHNDSYRGTNDYYLYCATGRGAGELAVGVYKNSTLLGEASVFLDLRDVKELYERWTLGDGNGGEPAVTPTAVATGNPTGVATQFNDSAVAGRSYILFVHGWNMAPWEKDAFAEAAFKRLYWQGYTNRFGALRWPTGYGFTDGLFTYPGPISAPKHYNESEFTAWKSGEGLRQRLLALNPRYPGKVYLMAHSMGNVVAGEALALQAEKFGGGVIVNTYVASQAAVPLDCYYRTNAPPVYQMPFTYEHPKQEQLAAGLVLWPGIFWTVSQLNGPVDWDTGTPNVYRGWLETNRASASRRVNFYNPNDYALNMPVWGFNQLLKPSSLGFGTDYAYVRFKAQGAVPRMGSSSVVTPAYFFLPSPARGGAPVLSGLRQRPGYFRAIGSSGVRILDFEFRLNDAYEAMSLGAEARTYPLGRIPAINTLDEELDLRSLWGTDTEQDPSLGQFGRHKWHSGQFRANYIRQQNYWRTLLGPQGFNVILQ